MFPVVIGVKRKMILFTPLPDSKTVCFLLSKFDGPFQKSRFLKVRQLSGNGSISWQQKGQKIKDAGEMALAGYGTFLLVILLLGIEVIHTCKF